MQRSTPRLTLSALPLAAAIAVVIVAVIVAAPGRAQAQQVRHALLLGNNLGHEPTRALRYAEQEVGRLGELLKRSGDFEAVDVLRGGSRADVEQALRRIADRLAVSRRAGRSTLFLFYYTGHGDNEALELGSSRLPLRDLRAYLEALPVDVRVAFVDACQSGALTGVKGGHRAAGFEVRLADTGNVKGLALVTSSTANELSQESDDLHASYFSHNLMAGLQGLADSSGDGQVTLGELYDFSFRRTLANTAANLAGGQHPTYDFRMSGTGDVILTRTRANDGRLRFPPEAGATYSVFHNGDVTAELASNQLEELYLAVPAGRYRVVRRVLAGVSERTVELPAGRSVTLDPREMMTVAVSVDPALRRKNSGPDQFRSLAQTLEAHVGVGTSAVQGTDAIITSAGVGYARRGEWLTGRLRADVSSFSADAQGYRSTMLRLTPALDLFIGSGSTGAVTFLAGPSLAMPFVRQHSDEGVHHSFGFRYGGAGLATLNLSARALVTATLDAGFEVFRLDGHVTNRPTAAFSLGGAFAF
ncbi:MAG TPA: caspase family protein [Polyangia bacterium]|nr:caspase family protein [Polyangia bacterium]